jgi:hypothetical protein
MKNDGDDMEVTFAEVFGSPVKYPVLTCQQLDTGNFEIEYLIEGILVAQHPAILAGTKKTLKTSMLVALGIALASGELFLGRFAVKRKCRVLMMSGESGLGTLQETARRVAHSLGVQLGDIDGLFWSDALPTFGDTNHAEALDQLLAELNIEVLIVDPAYLAMPSGDPGNLFAQGQLLRDFSVVCEKHKVTLILAHHAKKNQKSGAPPELESISWSGFQEWARQWLLIGRREDYEPGTGRHLLWLSVGGSAGHSGLWAIDVNEGPYRSDVPRQWEVTISSAEHASEERRIEKAMESLEKIQHRVLETLRKSSVGLSQTAIASLIGSSGQRIRQALEGLEASGGVRRIAGKGHGLYSLGGNA